MRVRWEQDMSNAWLRKDGNTFFPDGVGERHLAGAFLVSFSTSLFAPRALLRPLLGHL